MRYSPSIAEHTDEGSEGVGDPASEYAGGGVSNKQQWSEYASYKCFQSMLHTFTTWTGLNAALYDCYLVYQNAAKDTRCQENRQTSGYPGNLESVRSERQ